MSSSSVIPSQLHPDDNPKESFTDRLVRTLVGIASALLVIFVIKALDKSDPVIVPLESITLDNSSLSLEPGQTASLTVTFNPSNVTDKYVKWKSSDKNVAKVTRKGKVKAVGAGSATVTATCGGMSTDCDVTVNSDPVWNQ